MPAPGLHSNGTPQYMEANARTVEPGNVAASGVDLPALTIAAGAVRDYAVPPAAVDLVRR